MIRSVDPITDTREFTSGLVPVGRRLVWILSAKTLAIKVDIVSRFRMREE